MIAYFLLLTIIKSESTSFQQISDQKTHVHCRQHIQPIHARHALKKLHFTP